MQHRPTDPSGKNRSSRYYLMRYGSLAFQLLAALLLVIFAGVKIDKWLWQGSPVLAWIFPLLVIVGLILKILKDTSVKK
jgi:hypothetical protein